MLARDWGRIINMSSIYGLIGAVNRVDYVTSKTALIGMTRAVALECAQSGVTCNAVCPGSASTPAIEERVQAIMTGEHVSHDAAVEKFLAGKQPSGKFVEHAKRRGADRLPVQRRRRATSTALRSRSTRGWSRELRRCRSSSRTSCRRWSPAC